MTAGPEDRTPYAYYLWGASANNLSSRKKSSKPFSTTFKFLIGTVNAAEPITSAAGDTVHADLQNSTRELGLTWKFPHIKTMQEWSCFHRN